MFQSLNRMLIRTPFDAMARKKHQCDFFLSFFFYFIFLYFYQVALCPPVRWTSREKHQCNFLSTNILYPCDARLPENTNVRFFRVHRTGTTLVPSECKRFEHLSIHNSIRSCFWMFMEWAIYGNRFSLV